MEELALARKQKKCPLSEICIKIDKLKNHLSAKKVILVLRGESKEITSSITLK